jgi:hypothetical protein
MVSSGPRLVGSRSESMIATVICIWIVVNVSCFLYVNVSVLVVLRLISGMIHIAALLDVELHTCKGSLVSIPKCIGRLFISNGIWHESLPSFQPVDLSKTSIKELVLENFDGTFTRAVVMSAPRHALQSLFICNQEREEEAWSQLPRTFFTTFQGNVTALSVGHTMSIDIGRLPLQFLNIWHSASGAAINANTLRIVASNPKLKAMSLEDPVETLREWKRVTASRAVSFPNVKKLALSYSTFWIREAPEIQMAGYVKDFLMLQSLLDDFFPNVSTIEIDVEPNGSLETSLTSYALDILRFLDRFGVCE